jgi:hypothetical protein
MYPHWSGHDQTGTEALPLADNEPTGGASWPCLHLQWMACGTTGTSAVSPTCRPPATAGWPHSAGPSSRGRLHPASPGERAAAPGPEYGQRRAPARDPPPLPQRPRVTAQTASAPVARQGLAHWPATLMRLIVATPRSKTAFSACRWPWPITGVPYPSDGRSLRPAAGRPRPPGRRSSRTYWTRPGRSCPPAR